MGWAVIYNKGGVYITELVLSTNRSEICWTGDCGTVKNETRQGGEGEEQKEDMGGKKEKIFWKVSGDLDETYYLVLKSPENYNSFPKTDFSLELLRPLYLILMANLSGTILKKINLKQLIFNLSKMTLTFPN